MRVDSLTSTGSQLILNRPTPSARGASQTVQPKTLGETPPIVLDLAQIGRLAALFGSTGLIGRLRKRLNHLKRKKCKIVPAKGMVACVDDDDVVYLGVDLIEAYQNEPETIAGIMAHEWGHAVALKPHPDNLQKLNWNQIFELRRAHETLADEISGRLLCLMGYGPEGLMNFLTHGKDTHNLKYHNPETRVQVIRYGYNAEKRKVELARQLFPKKTYDNEYHTVLLDIA